MHFTIASLILALVASITRVSAVPIPAPSAGSFPQQVNAAPPTGAPPSYYPPPPGPPPDVKSAPPAGYYAPPPGPPPGPPHQGKFAPPAEAPLGYHPRLPGPPPLPANTILKVYIDYFDGTSLSSTHGPNREIMIKAFEKYRLMPQNQRIFQGVGYCVLRRSDASRLKDKKASFWKSLLKGKLPRKTKTGTYECNKQQNDGRVVVSGEFTWSGRTVLRKVVDYLVYSPPSTGGAASAFTFDNTLSALDAIPLGEGLGALDFDLAFR